MKIVAADETDTMYIADKMQYGDILDLGTQVETKLSSSQNNVVNVQKNIVSENKEKTDIGSNVTEAEQNRDIANDVAESYKITYTSSDIAVASVSQNGTVYANGAGKATITATANGVSAAFEINVAKLEVSPSAGIRVGAGEKVTLKAKLKNGLVAETDKIKWSVDDTSKVKITTLSDGSAVVKTNKKGEVTVTASYGEYSTKTVLHIRRVPSKITPEVIAVLYNIVALFLVYIRVPHKLISAKKH